MGAWLSARLSETSSRAGLAVLLQTWGAYFAAYVGGTSDMQALLAESITASTMCLIAIVYPEGQRQNPPNAGPSV